MTRTRWKSVLALLLALGLTVAVTACGNDNNDEAKTATTSVEGPTIRIAPQDFAEAKTLTEVYAQYLEAKGFDVSLAKPDGFRAQVYPDLQANKLDLVIDYAGSAVAFLDKTKAGSADPAGTAATLDSILATKGLVAGTYSPAEDQNALVATKAFADEHGLKNISDLSKVGGTIKLAGAEDCRERTDCLKGYTDPAKYGLKMAFTAVSYGPPLIAALDSGTAQVVQYQTTAAELASGKYVVLKDDKQLLSSDNIVPVVRKALADAYGQKLKTALDKVSAALTTDDLIQFNVGTDQKKEEPADIAKAWLKDKGLI